MIGITKRFQNVIANDHVDFNLYAGANKDDPTIEMINDAGYREVESLIGQDTNASKTESYDRLFITQNPFFRIEKNENGRESGGVFDLFQYVYSDQSVTTYKKTMQDQYTGSKDLDVPANLKKYYLNPWRKNQMSDHFPIWFELCIDSSEQFLSQKLKEL